MKNNWVKYWGQQNKDNELKLYCQSCCYRYPDCIFIDELHPYDTFAENCPDFVPKDIYKDKSRAKCLQKRLQIEPDYRPLPDNLIWHPVLFPAVCDSTQYFRIITREKAMEYIDK